MATVSPQSATPSGGTAKLTWQVSSSAVRWIVSQVTCELVPPLAGSAVIRLDTRLIAATTAGAGDAATGAPYVTLNPGNVLSLEWENVSPLVTQAIGTILYDEVAR